MIKLASPRWGWATTRVPALVELPLVAPVLLFAAITGSWLLTILVFDPNQHDVSLYHDYAVRLLEQGRLPIEYPPLAALVFLAALGYGLVSPDVTFPAAMALVLAVAYRLVGLGFGRRRALAMLAYAAAGGLGTLVERYDLTVALTVVAAIWLLRRRRWRLAALALALGTLLKLFPAVLMPVALIAAWRGAGSRLSRTAAMTGIFSAVVAAGVAAAALSDPHGWLSPYRYAAGRPPEVESVLASVIGYGWLAGLPAAPNLSFGSDNFAGPLAQVLSPLSTLLTAAGLLITYALVWFRRLAWEPGLVAVIAVVLATSKVFSAQYYIWLVAPAAVVFGWQWRWLVFGALTSLVYPVLFYLGVNPVHAHGFTYEWPLVAGIGLRNLVLIWIIVRLWFGEPRWPLAAPAGSAGPSR